MDKYILLLTLKNIDKIGNITAKKIIDSVMDKEIEMHDLFKILQDFPSIKIKDIEKLHEAYNKAKELLIKVNRGSINMITYLDENYPKSLLLIKDIPLILFYSGDINLISKKCVAIVGTRKPSEIGKEISYNLSKKLCKEYVIVSGLAEGIDTQAHKAAVENNGKTISILGQAIDNIFPQKNIELSKKIISGGGLILSEYAPGQATSKYNFIARDRLQSAISEKVFIVESNIDGGAMHTAKKAKEYNKELLTFKSKNKDYQIPSGNLLLIKEGAKTFDEDY